MDVNVLDVDVPLNPPLEIMDSTFSEVGGEITHVDAVYENGYGIRVMGIVRLPS